MTTIAKDMYVEFLDGINKNSVSVVTPDIFNKRINLAYISWLSEKANQFEVTQKRDDDLRNLIVITDGTVYAPIESTTGIFTIPSNYPLYYRLLSVMFKVQYSGNSCYADGVISDWKSTSKLTSNEKAKIFDNPYKKPKDDRLYYKLVSDKIYSYTGTSSVCVSANIEYIKQPDQIFFNEKHYEDTGDSTTGSVGCELPLTQRSEIVEIAVRKHLERVKDPRYKSFINEQVMSAQNK